MNLWHDIPLGENAPDEFNTIVEIPRGSHNKYEIDKETGLIKLDRVNFSAAAYPFDYGFAPQTLWEDGDALDVADINKHTLKEMKHFFEHNKALKKKPVEITVGGFEGREAAIAAIKRSIDLYSKKFGK